MATDAAAEVRVEGQAEPAFIDAVHSALAELWSRVDGIGDEDRDLFTLAVSEVATNIVAHGSAREPIEVSLTLSVEADSLSAVFADSADPALINLRGVSMPGVDAESGRGLALALLTLDELVHETDSGNVWRLRRRLRA